MYSLGTTLSSNKLLARALHSNNSVVIIPVINNLKGNITHDPITIVQIFLSFMKNSILWLPAVEGTIFNT